MQAVFKINGKDLPIPAHKGFRITLADVDSPKTTRNAKGYLKRARVRAGMRKLQVTYNFLDAPTCKLILDALEPVEFSVTWLDPQLGVVTRTMYVGDRELPTYGSTSSGEFRWENLSFSLIEV